jgi:hypothetical protein
MNLEIDDIPAAITASKRKLRAAGAKLETAFAGMNDAMLREIDDIRRVAEAGGTVIPEVEYADIADRGFSDADTSWIRRRGCLVVRNTFPRALAEEWNERVGEYIDELGYLEQPDKGLDNYFSSLQDARPQIYSVYWSKPQIEARQHPNLARVRQLLNRLWRYEYNGARLFDPDKECTYADRVRRREPGDTSIGLKPHADGGSIERWLEQSGFHPVYRRLIEGDWEAYDPFDARARIDTGQIPSPAVCSMFRTFQGWTALTAQGPGDGTLQLIPVARAMGWMFLRALQDDVPDDSLCGATAGRALSCNPEWHGLALEGLCSIPQLEPGDSVWWHGDVVHGVEDAHTGTGYSNVIYIGAAPFCRKNAAFLPGQAACFLEGRSSPDFAPEDYELDFEGRARPEDLSDLGRRQMGLADW